MISEMAADLVSGNPLLAGPILAVLIFCTIFIAAFVRTLRADKGEIARLANLPFDEEEQNTPNDTSTQPPPLPEVHHG